MSADKNARAARHWARTRSLTIQVLVVWVIFAIIVPYMAGPLNAYSFLGFPLGYWFCVQGSLIIFAALIWYQNWRQDAIDDEAGFGE